MDTFEGRVAVVTGAANGIGYALAERGLEAGMKVVLADIERQRLETAAVKLSAKGEILAHVVDVADPGSLQALADAALQRFGAVNLLCNKAGVGGFQRFATTSRETWAWTLGVDLWGVIDGCRIFLPILKRQEQAHILNTASMSGFVYGPYLHPYSVAKAGVVALSEGLYREFEKDGCHVGVSVLCPAFTATDIADDERNAPPGVARRGEFDADLAAVREGARYLMAQGKTPVAVAEIAFQAVRERRLHIFPHPSWLEAVGARIDNIRAGRPVGDEPASVLRDPTT